MVARGLMPVFYLIAGEPSGDRLGAALMAGLKTLVPDVQFYGVGGPQMQAQGLQSQFPMQELSVMGIAEVLPKYFALKRRITECADAVVKLHPDALITIDSPDFCLRVARLVKAASQIRTIHYVAPTVWAWRPNRAWKMAEVIDHVLALFPFEPPYMKAVDMGCSFVGHPVVAEPQATATEAKAFRLANGIAQGVPLVLALPGSRRGEVARLAPRFGRTLRRVLIRHPKARVIVPTVDCLFDLVSELTADWPGDPIVLRAGNPPTDAPAKAAAFAAADVALAASGTVSLELAASRTPMVIGYDMAWLSRLIISRMVRLDTVTLVNIISNTRTVPEFLGADCQPERMAPAVLSLMEPGPLRDAQMAAMALTLERLGQGGAAPGLRAAQAVLAVIAQDAGRSGGSNPAGSLKKS